MQMFQQEQLAKEVGVDSDTLNNWVNELKIPLPEKYQQNAIQILKLVKSLKDKDCGFQTIQRQIQVDYPELKADSSQADYTAFMPETMSTGVDELSQHFASLSEQVMKLGELGELAEKYAQANYNIGQMSMQMRQLEDENHRLKAQVKLLPTPEEWEHTQEQLTTYRNLLQGMQQRITALEERGSEALNARRSLPELPAAELQRRQLTLPFESE